VLLQPLIKWWQSRHELRPAGFGDDGNALLSRRLLVSFRHGLTIVQKRQLQIAVGSQQTERICNLDFGVEQEFQISLGAENWRFGRVGSTRA
jgi:hypothetical protein